MTLAAGEGAMADRDKRALLLVEAQITPAWPGAAPVDIRRGMPVRSRDGEDAGQVAAVVIDAGSHASTHVLLSRWRESLDYRLVPIGLVRGVEAGVVTIEIPGAAVDGLPVRDAACT